MEPLGPDWIIAENQPCQVHNPRPEPDETVCGRAGASMAGAHGEGRLVWRLGNGVDLYEGEMRAGEQHG